MSLEDLQFYTRNIMKEITKNKHEMLQSSQKCRGKFQSPSNKKR